MKIQVPNPIKHEGWQKVNGRTYEPPSISYRAPTLAERGRAHWERFHTMELTPESLAEWESEIPSFGCACKAKYREIKAANPPRFDDPHVWRWEIHNAVNEHLEKPFFEWEEYAAKWLGG